MIDFRIKEMFLDRDQVINAVSKARRAALAKFGAFVRRTAQRSIRRGRGSSPPGQPPTSHAGTLRRLIFFGYDQAAESVVVGPVQFGEGTAPSALEYGGESMVTTGGRGLVKQGRKVRERKRLVSYKPRPFMVPALDENIPKFPGLFDNSIR